MASGDSSVLQETILKAIDAVVTQRNNELKLDKTITAIVKKNVGIRNNKPLYEVEYEGGRLIATAQNSTDSYIPNTSVYVLIPQGNFSNEKIIIGRASSIVTDRSASVVAAAVNSYSIIGANLIEADKNTTYGLRSFHDHTLEPNGCPIEHRLQTLYNINGDSPMSFNNERLDIYRKQTTALMLKADFQTNLDIEQRRQSKARYGLIFNFSFDNLNKGYGETNGEIFTNLAPIVQGKVIDLSKEDGVADRILFDYNAEINENNNFSDSKLDQYIEEIKTLYDNFLVNKKKLATELINNLVKSYLILLGDLKNISEDPNSEGFPNRKNEYIKWWNERVGEPGQKIEHFILTSDMMLGNPLAFSQWSTQYTIFNVDMNTFNHLDSIYFFKEGFHENSAAEKIWPTGVEGGGPDIFVKNLQIYALKPLEAQSGDYSLKVEPYQNNDAILSSENPETKFKATLLRLQQEDLTFNNVQYFWFKEDPSVINAKSDGYDFRAGPGWKLLPLTDLSAYFFSAKIEDNLAYENKYKCVAIYTPSGDNEVILAVSFSVYNQEAEIKIKLESDIGTEFSFNKGTPTIKVLVHNHGMEEDKYAEIGFKQDREYEINDINYSANSPRYLYKWAVTDSVNGEKIFLADNEENNENFLLVSAKQSLLNKISYYTFIGYYDDDEEIKEVEDSSYATRIKYPVYATSSGFTVECFLQEYKKDKNNNIGKYYNVGSAKLEFENLNENLASSDFRIQIVNGDQVFQYDEYGNAPTVNKLKEPLEVQPLQAKLISRSGLEIEGSNYNVEWIFPIEDTLITTTETLVENSASQLIQSYHARECNFGIQEIYNPSYYNNQITCHISFNDIDLYKDTNFYFGKIGSNGTNGTDVVAKIEYAKNDDINRLHYEPLTLYVQKGKYGNNENEIENAAQFNVRDADGNLNDFKETETLVGSENNSLLKLVLYQKNTPLGKDSYAPGYPRWNIAGNAYASELTSSNNTGKFFELTSNLSSGSNSLTWKYNFQNDDKHFRIQNIQAEVKVKTGETYYAYFSLPIIEYKEGQKLPLKLHKDTIAIDKPTYLNEIVYNADGRNPIYNHNAGLKLINLPEGARVKWTAKGGFGGQRSQYSNNIESIEEDTPSISLLENRDDREGQTEITTDAIDGSSMVYVLPADEFNGSSTNNRIEAEVSVNGNLIATVYAPINMILNTFGLASVNAWDGNTITIDNERGAVLAPQVAAGEKDDNNRFTGIVMGKTETYTGGSDSEKQIGLFGYHQGLQSIFLDSDTGNATFGLPDVENGYYKNTSVQCNDDYNEGRIELRPGGESKIGGWRLGRHSLYYTMSPKKISDQYVVENDSYVYNYSGIIGDKYLNDKETPKRRQYGLHHDKDITPEDSGILISAKPPYISVVGGMLTAHEISEDANGHLTDGDAIEMQLDPKTPTVFTIFRHNGRNRGELAGTRTYLAGINSKGQLQANAVGSAGDANNQTTMYIGRIKAFEQTINEDPAYVGSVFEAGDSAETLPFLTMFVKQNQLIQNNNINKNAHVYMTGGNFGPTATAGGENYGREISLHAKSLDLYARDSDSNNKDKETTDANIKISTDSSQIQLGDNVGLLLNRKNTNDNYLKTSGIFNLDIGVSGNRKNLSVNAAAVSATINGMTITNAGNTNLSFDGSTTLNSKGNIGLYRKNKNNQIESELLLRDSDNTAFFGIPPIKGNNTNTDIKRGYISLSGAGQNTWSTLGTIHINSTNSGNAILIHADHLGSGIVHNGDTSPQLELRAGTGSSLARVLLSSSNNTWTGSKEGVPIQLSYGSNTVQMRTALGHWEWYVGMHESIAGGLGVIGPYLGRTSTFMSGSTNYNADIRIDISGKQTRKIGNNNVDYYGMIKTDSFWSTSDAHSIYFNWTDFTNTYGGTTTYTVGANNLKDAINGCLYAAAEAKALANAAQTAANNAQNTANTAYNSIPDVSNFVTQSNVDNSIRNIGVSVSTSTTNKIGTVSVSLSYGGGTISSDSSNQLIFS